MELDVSCLVVDDDLVATLGVSWLSDQRMVPVRSTTGTPTLVCDTAPADALLHELRVITGACVAFDIADDSIVDELLSSMTTGGEVTERGGQLDTAFDDLAYEGDIVSLVQRAVEEAVRIGASDIHVEPEEGESRIRFRRDGRLETVGKFLGDAHQQVVARIKVLAKLDVAEKRRPQDGKIGYEVAGRELDLRISTAPMSGGEKVVIRLLNRSDTTLSLHDLGFSDDATASFSQAISRPYGMILVTGPTGSGKTTTLYAALNQITSDATNIVTIEDPIEYSLAGVNQSQVKPEIGYTFSAALRSFLRQDPDVIMVGEIRDAETADIAARAAMTGHLVLSTLHTNDAVSAIGRLLDLGVPRFMIASTLVLVVAQRLVRKICQSCRGEGCASCRQTGLAGRTAIAEMLQVDRTLASALHGGDDLSMIGQRARTAGMQSLRESGLEKVARGITTEAEVLRETA